MKLINLKDDILTLNWVVTKVRPPQWTSSFIIKGTFPLAPDVMPVEPLEGKDPVGPMGDIYVDDNPEKSLQTASDFVPFKPLADVLLNGSAHAPGGEPVRFLQVWFKVGSMAKSMAVFGKRMFASMDEPEAFIHMPLLLENAFGGPNDPNNPIGKGRDGEEMPNLEQPDEPVTSPRDKIAPAHLGPWPMHWPQRAARLGTYRKDWLKKHWPWLPEDFDFRHFNAASDDQMVEDYLRGDEPVELVNLHPDHAHLKTCLPGVRARCFLEIEQEQDTLLFKEVTLRLDTLVIEPDADRAQLVWRGLEDVMSVKMREIRYVMILLEPLDQPDKPLDHYRTLLHDTLDQEKLALKDVPGEDFDPKAEVDKRLKQGDALRADLEKEEAATKQHVLEQTGALQKQSDAKATSLGLTAAIAAAAAKGATGPDFSSLPDELPPKTAKAMAGNPEALAQSNKMLKDAKAEGPKTMERFDQAQKEMDEKTAEARKKFEPGTDRPAVEASARGPNKMKGKDLSDLDLSELDLTGMDLSDANLAGANLSKSTLRGARLYRAILTGADLTGADLTGAYLEKADLRKANVDKAVIQDCVLDMTDLSGLNLEKFDFKGCHGKFTDFSKTKLNGARFCETCLDKPDFSKCEAANADFRGAVLTRADFDSAKAPGIMMQGANIANLRAGKDTDFSNGQFQSASAEGSVLGEAKLDHADFSRAVLMRSLFSGAVLKNACFDRADLRGCVFDDAILDQALITCANALRASFCRARLTRTVFDGSNLYEAGFMEALLEQTSFYQAGIKRTLLDNYVNGKLPVGIDMSKQ